MKTESNGVFNKEAFKRQHDLNEKEFQHVTADLELPGSPLETELALILCDDLKLGTKIRLIEQLIRREKGIALAEYEAITRRFEK